MKYLKNKRGFTLTELLAVIAILAIILLIAIPKILNTIELAKKSAFKSNAILVLDAIDLKEVEDETFDPITLSVDNIEEKLNIDNDNFKTLEVTEGENGYILTITGDSAWSGYTATGTKAIMQVTLSEEVEVINIVEPNIPNLPSNMIPIYYDETLKIWKKADVDNEEGEYQWYDYSEKKWANAVTVKETGTNTRTYYKTAAVGTTIPDDDILTFMVWIPRYKYLIPEGTGARQITIAFESTETEKSVGDAITTYRTHPAFTFGSGTEALELNGIWVGKFETSADPTSSCYLYHNLTYCNVSTNTPIIKSNVCPWRYAKLSTYFTAIRNMENTGNIYGYVAAEVDTHIILNSEWGAVAYLAYSIYGKNSEIWPNPKQFLTGQAGTSSSSASVSFTANYNEENEYGIGPNASTTGNIYGIYDMSAGSDEYVMANYNNLLKYSGFSTLPAAKYYNLYTLNVYGTACGGGICYGHSLSETNGWNEDTTTPTNFINTTFPWLSRGASYYQGKTAGIFATTYRAGYDDSGMGCTTRVVQVEE